MSTPVTAPGAPPKARVLTPRRSLVMWRRVFWDRIIVGACYLSAALVVLPLGLILWHLITLGASGLSIEFFTHMPKPVGEAGGGMANAIVGTLILVGLGALIAVPIGIAAGIYLAEYGRSKFAGMVRYTAELLSGVPSIVVGVAAYGLVVVPMGHFSALAGGVALAILMLPTVIRSTEEMIRLVPQSYRHGALALALAERKELAAAIEFASAVAALKCTRFGGRAGIPRRDEFERWWSQRR